MRSKTLIAVGAACMWALGSAYAEQTGIFVYDALGRLKQTQIQSGPGSGVTRTYQYDAAGNRTQTLVSGSTGSTPVTLSMSSLQVNVTPAGAPLTVNLSGAPTGGTVTFTENGVFLGSTWVMGGQAGIFLEGFPNGSHTITVSYSGDGTHAAQTTTFTIKVQDLRWLPGVLELLLSEPTPPGGGSGN